MAKNRFFIGPYTSGMQDNLKPFLLPEDAFASMNNAYVFRGRVRKRFGARLLDQSQDVPQLFSRLRIALTGGAGVGTTDGAGAATGTIPGAASYHADLGKMFSIGDVMYSVYQAGAPATMLITDGTTTATYDTTSGAYNFVGAPAGTQIYFYPALPVMGLPTFETEEINDDLIVGFDTQFAYEHTVTGWERLIGGTDTWTGSDSEFFWGETWRGVAVGDSLFFVTNFNATDGIRYYDPVANTWITRAYISTGANTINSCKMIIAFKNRLLFLSTKETVAAAPTNFQNRVRWSLIGNPTVAATSFLESPGQGGFEDAPTKEAIVSAKIVKDHLIVFFERSTYELVYTNNQVQPFVFQKIDSELGAESTFASVLFDKDIVGVGNVGIHACNGSFVRRIDERIPEAVFNIHNENAGVDRVYGIRDYEAEMIYWSFPSQANDTTYPNRVLVYNYVNGSWAFNDDTVTCFGYFQQQNDITWSSLNETWEGYDEPWNSGDFQALDRTVIAGNQEGFTFVINKDLGRNAPALQISNITVPGRVQLQIINHNFTADEFILIEDCQGDTTLNGNVYQVSEIVDDDNIQIIEPAYVGAYTGGGLVTRMSKIDIYTKNFNFFSKEGRNFTINKTDFLVDRTTDGEFTVDYLPAYSQFPVFSSMLETAPYDLYPFESVQKQLWHPMYPDAEGSGIQLRIYLSDEQMFNKNIVFSDFQLNAMLFNVDATASRLQ